MRHILRRGSSAQITRIGVPAAIVGTLTAALAATPAHASGAHADRSPAQTWRQVPASTAPDTYIVAPGDTVWGIAIRYGVRVADVLAWNGLTSGSVIHPGDTVVLRPPAAAAPAPAAPAPAPAATHTVSAGETLSAIAARHGIPLRALFDANGLGWHSVIHPGQQIALPGAAAAPAPAPAPAPAAPETAPQAPSPAAAVHTVSAGETLSGIAAAHGVSLQAVFDANGLGPGSIIYPGQQISLPGTVELAVATAPAPAPAEIADLDAEQTANARLIVQIGREIGVPDRGIAIALATAMVESWVRNLDWGDRDSLGLFQQRPSTGWGTEGEIRDAARSIRVFYGGAADPNGDRTRGLLDVAGWEQMGFAEAAQAVQVSAFPDRYGQWESRAYAWLAALG
ncbi:LysM domain-containing protein [Microbacterium limosum]|uniref:LysM domain-containing protein n=1 Tax=Microbacterium limosum TaxID=3079935 RepID=A0AAU0MJV8_9MICO|nr:LysM domain-containing protein [Microbacterium sp. Y20]WOQ70456.1 LysM domain-containing protein [Microbacterium sp. Y20]